MTAKLNPDTHPTADNEIVARVFPLPEGEQPSSDEEEHARVRRLQRMAQVLAFQEALQQ